MASIPYILEAKLAVFSSESSCVIAVLLISAAATYYIARGTDSRDSVLG
jgi:hypothetical protein